MPLIFTDFQYRSPGTPAFDAEACELLVLGPDFIGQGVVLLVCLLHSHQVDWFGHDGYTLNILIECNFNVDTVDTAKTRLYSVKFKSELVKQTVEIPKMSNCVIQGRCWQRSRVNQVRLANYANELSGK